MDSQVIDIALGDLVFDNSIYPRLNVDHRRVALFVENLRDGFHFTPFTKNAHVGKFCKYRIKERLHHCRNN